MSRLMQLPGLYLRGSIATQTMAHLSNEQIQRADRIVREVEDDQSLAADRHEFIRQLGATIKSDYRSDPIAALQEFRIAIWRATIHLLYHRDYNYVCSICGATEYRTCTDKDKALDRQYKACPKCGQSYLEHGGHTSVVKIEPVETGYVAANETGVLTGIHKDRSGIESAVRSPILTIHGPPKIGNPEEILKDPVQRGKWYTVWIWNYFRQILNENIIRTHNKHQVDVSDVADRIAFRLIINELRRGSYKYTYDESMIYAGKPLTISAQIMATAPDFSQRFIAPLINEYRGYEVDIAVSPNGITISRLGDPPMINATIETEDQVVMLSFEGPTNNNSEGDDRSWSDILETNKEGDTYDGELDRYIADEAMATARANLPPKARIAFDIYSQQGDAWADFSSKWGEQSPRKVHLAKFLGINTKDVDNIRRMIQAQCLINNIKQSENLQKTNRSLERSMRDAENTNLHDIDGNIFDICTMYRYLSRGILRYNVIYKYEEIPIRLRRLIGRAQYEIIARRMDRFVRQYA